MAEPESVNNWFRSASSGNLAELQNNIVRINVNRQQRSTGQTALMLATFNRHADCVRWLLSEERADVNIRDNTNQTALVKAARVGAFECMELLIDHGAILDSAHDRYNTPLMRAVCNERTKCAELLIERGAALQMVDNLGSTAMMKAAYANSAICVESLLRAGALVNITDNNGQTALIKAAATGDPLCVKLLLDNNAHVAIMDRTGATAIVKAVSQWSPDRQLDAQTLQNNLQCLRLLCERGADVNAVDHKHETALMKASAIGFTEAVHFLINERQAVVDNFNDFGQTAITLAAKNNHSDVVRFLCAHDRKNLLNIFDLRGYTPIMHAAFNGNCNCVHALAELGAGVNVVDQQLNTPLMMMARAGCHQAMAALLRAGADPFFKNAVGRTALDVATTETCRRVLQ